MTLPTVSLGSSKFFSYVPFLDFDSINHTEDYWGSFLYRNCWVRHGRSMGNMCPSGVVHVISEHKVGVHSCSHFYSGPTGLAKCNL